MLNFDVQITFQCGNDLKELEGFILKNEEATITDSLLSIKNYG